MQPDGESARVLFVGRSTFDVLYRLNEWPEEDTKPYAQALHAAPGGPATNAALTDALLGGESVLISPLGRGAWAEQVRDALEQYGVRHIDLAGKTAYETPLVTVLVNTARATRTAINPPLTEAAFPALPTSWPVAWGGQPRVALTDGFHLDATLGLLRALNAEGTALVLDGGSWKPGTAELAPLLTAAICSERFAAPDTARTAEATLAWFAAQGVPYVAVTRGPKPIVAMERGRRFEVEIDAVDALDTLGAGDVLHGTFCHHFARSGHFESALRAAATVATRACTGLGIDAWLD